MPNAKQAIEFGSIVKPTDESGFFLRSGCENYQEAVVISMDPFVLTSLESDMRWQHTIKREYFYVVGQADESTLAKCMRRLNS